MKSGSVIKQLLATGLALHQQGEIGEVERCFQKILLLDPKHPENLHCLGAIALQRGQNDKAVELMSRSVALDDCNAESHFHLGRALAVPGRNEETSPADGRRVWPWPPTAAILAPHGLASWKRPLSSV